MSQAEPLTEFQSPWNEDFINPITFKALYDDKNLDFSFYVSDKDIYTDVSSHKDENIGNSDRVELFFRSDLALNPYYCLEIDTAVRLMNFEERPGKNFDFKWNWPKQDIKLESTIHSTYFLVEGIISLKSLRDLNLLKGNKIETGVFRAKYKKMSLDNLHLLGLPG